MKLNPVVQGNHTGEIENWIQEEHIIEIFKNINEKFFNKYDINWNLKNIKEYDLDIVNNESKQQWERNKGNYTLDKSKTSKHSLDFISTLTRDTNKYPDSLRIKSYRDLIKQYNSNYHNIYFCTFNGNTRQGYANINNGFFPNTLKDVAFTLIGTWSNKQTRDTPIKRIIYHEEGEPSPSLTFTVAHELGHVFGLQHLKTNEPNIMNATTSELLANRDQVSTMKKTAKKFDNLFKQIKNNQLIIEDVTVKKPLLSVKIAIIILVFLSVVFFLLYKYLIVKKK